MLSNTNYSAHLSHAVQRSFPQPPSPYHELVMQLAKQGISRFCSHRVMFAVKVIPLAVVYIPQNDFHAH